MKTRFLLGVLTVMCLVVVGGAVYFDGDRQGVNAQGRDQRALVENLRSAPDDPQRGDVIASIRRIPAEERDPTVIRAIAQELHRLKSTLRDRGLDIASGKQVAPATDEGEYLHSVLEVAAQHKDLESLEALEPFIGTGVLAMNAVADFGEDAFAEVLRMASSNDPADDASMAIETLRRMLERSSVRKPLSLVSRRTILDLARSRLSGAYGPAVAMAAIRLAVTTGDPALTQRVRELATDPSAAKQIAGDLPATAVQNIAKNALAAQSPH